MVQKSSLEKQIEKMNVTEHQKEIETNALIKHTLEDLKKYQSMDQMKEEEAAELRNSTNILEKKVKDQEKVIHNLDAQLSQSMKSSMKAISELNEELIQTKNKEVKLLNQVVETKQKYIGDETSLKSLNQALLGENDKIASETRTI